MSYRAITKVGAFRILSPAVAAVALFSLGAPPAWAGDDNPPPPAVSNKSLPAPVQDTEQSVVVGKPTLTAAQQQETATTEAAVLASTSNKVSARAGSHKSVAKIKQVAQQRNYWCGPATLVSLVKADGDSISQKTAASKLKTNSSGTAWYDGGYPIAMRSR